MNFELIHKPTFTNQLLGVPKEQITQILEKIELLRDNPKTQGNLKKRLHGYRGKVYRLRCGDYRIIYTYGNGWVSLLGVDQRKDVYNGKKLVAESVTVDVYQIPTTQQLLTPINQGGRQENASATSTFISETSPSENDSSSSTLLPVELTEAFLQQLRIPTECFAALSSCQTLDDLIAAPIPDELRERVFDAVATPDFDRVLQQPSFVTGTTADLLQFKQGNLLGFLLKLNPEQEKYVTWALNSQGATLLKGGPGTGKSTIALYRVKAMLESLQNDSDAAIKQKTPKILFTTYTNALVAFSEQLLKNLLGDAASKVEVQTVDAIAYNLVQTYTQKPNLASSKQQHQLLKQALAQTLDTLPGNRLQQLAYRQTLQRLSLDYLLSEINTVIEAREIDTLEAYLTTPRPGRVLGLNKSQRRAIWHLRQNFYEKLQQQGLETWEQLRTRALNILRTMPNPPVYDGVVVDEAQDLHPNALRLLIQLCQAQNRLFITADANQSIYGGSFRWQDIHQDLKFVGRTGVLRTNHRTTREINEAACHYLAEGKIDSEADQREYIHTGPPPAIRAVQNRGDEAALLSHFCRTATREFRLGLGACAILVPSEAAGQQLVPALQYQGLAARYMSSRNLDLNWKGVKLLTLKAAKGLEFPIVAIAGLGHSPFPYIPKDTPEAALSELYQQERRSLFVAMTRAMRALLVVISTDYESPLLTDFDPQLWNLGEDEIARVKNKE